MILLHLYLVDLGLCLSTGTQVVSHVTSTVGPSFKVPSFEAWAEGSFELTRKIVAISVAVGKAVAFCVVVPVDVGDAVTIGEAAAVCVAIAVDVSDADEAVIELAVAVGKATAVADSGFGIYPDAFVVVVGTLSSFAVGFDADADGFAGAGADAVFCLVCARFRNFREL